MILNMLVTVGSTDEVVVQKSVTFYGGVNETLILYGVTNQTVVLDGNGIGSATVPTGNYILMGSLSKAVYPNGRSITITSDTSIVTAYPEGAIYWFGNGDSSGDSLYSKCGGFIGDNTIHPAEVSRGYNCDISVSDNTNNIGLNYSYNGYGTNYVIGAAFYMKNSISTDGYNSLNIVSSGSGTFYTVNSIVTNYPYVSKANSSLSAVLTPAPYLTFYYGDYATLVDSSTLVKAIYLT